MIGSRNINKEPNVKRILGVGCGEGGSVSDISLFFLIIFLPRRSFLPR